MSRKPSALANALGMQSNASAGAFLIDQPLRKIICANPECKIEFKQVRRWQRFCTVKCRNDEYWSRHKRITAVISPEQTATTKPKPIES